MVCRDCLGRTPFASLIATILCCIGVGIFCAALYRALEITLVAIFEELYQFPIPWLETIQIVFLIIAIVMGLYALLLLVFGFLATGATRQNIYSGAKCIMGGRMSAAFFMVVTYILNVLWVGVTSVTALPIIIYVMLNSICLEEIENKAHWYWDDYGCFNLSRFGIYHNETEGVTRNALCDENDIALMCDYVNDAGPMYGLALGGSLIIVMGMVMFMVTMAINYNRIMMSKEITEYRDAVDLELTDGTGVLGTLSTGSKQSLT